MNDNIPQENTFDIELLEIQSEIHEKIINEFYSYDEPRANEDDDQE